ncbi:hypothetical protein BDV25DRAFT_79947 [Aspergillus avenaceus]|uniref:Uncharacterized protein n=1 Tax=Aspergillus avenaceus TaxID=36643 RepID=A0A5N6TF50_ASPAV|nr:hypothetical protein BDV25DRAFT_79947 [Aspergillus avenaceus]
MITNCFLLDTLIACTFVFSVSWLYRAVVCCRANASVVRNYIELSMVERLCFYRVCTHVGIVICSDITQQVIYHSEILYRSSRYITIGSRY